MVKSRRPNRARNEVEPIKGRTAPKETDLELKKLIDAFPKERLRKLPLNKKIKVIGAASERSWAKSGRRG
jgi:hypothetical protein